MRRVVAPQTNRGVRTDELSGCERPTELIAHVQFPPGGVYKRGPADISPRATRGVCSAHRKAAVAVAAPLEPVPLTVLEVDERRAHAASDASHAAMCIHRRLDHGLGQHRRQWRRVVTVGRTREAKLDTRHRRDHDGCASTRRGHRLRALSREV